MRDTIRLFDLRLEDSLKKRPDPFDFSGEGYSPPPKNVSQSCAEMNGCSPTY
jgi:hypothetical protein